MSKKHQITLYLPPAVLEGIRNDAAKNLRSISAQIEYILQQNGNKK